MTGQITTADVRQAIEARRSPQCYEQIARAIELRLKLTPGSVTGQRLARHVKTLLTDGHVVVLNDPSLVRQLGAFPQHYPRQTKFYLSTAAAEVQLDADTFAPLTVATSSAKPEGQRRPTSPPGARRPAANPAPSPRSRPAAEPPVDQARVIEQPGPDTARPAAHRSVRHLRAVGTPSLSFLSAKLNGPAGAPQFSSAPDQGEREVSAEEMLNEVTAHIAATFSDAARRLQAQADAAVLPLNKAWHAGKFGTDTDYVAQRLSELYDLATSNASALATDAATILGTTVKAILAEGTHA